MKQNIGTQIRDRRLILRKRKAAMARDLGVSDTTITNYESGITIPDHDTIEKIEKILDFKIVR